MAHDNRRSISEGHACGDWILKERLGRGGNGEVWMSTSPQKRDVAVKCLTKIKPGAYRRFKDEVEVLTQIKDVIGILPILDSYLPDISDKREAWYVTPLAIPSEDWSEFASPVEKVNAIAEVATTMAVLHNRKIAHRDIKSANLVIFEGRCHVIDFGLVTYLGKENFTARNEDIGPKWTMAPEVRRYGADADPFKADVFSLAKTLWSLLRNDFRGFDGQYNDDSSISITPLFDVLHTTPLIALLCSATSHNPQERPTMFAFAEGLIDWLVNGNDFLLVNQVQWKEAINSIFPLGLPKRAEWTKAKEIAQILHRISGRSLNHAFYPTGGGNDLKGAKLSIQEREFIELDLGGYPKVMKPARLIFEGLSENYEWNYFRLELARIKPKFDLSPEIANHDAHEVLIEVENRFYDSEDTSEYSYEGYEDVRKVERWLHGAFVVFQKSSFYNLSPAPLDAYDGRHNNKDADAFRLHVEDMRDAVTAKGIDLKKGRGSKRTEHPAFLLRQQLPLQPLPDDDY